MRIKNRCAVKYQYNKRIDRETESLWLCEKCKALHQEDILLGRLKLIDKREDDRIKCDRCEGNGSDIS